MFKNKIFMMFTYNNNDKNKTQKILIIINY